MRAIITIEMDGAAFEDRPNVELALLLTELIECNVRHGARSQKLLDSNGNACGTFEIVEDAPSKETQSDFSKRLALAMDAAYTPKKD